MSEDVTRLHTYFHPGRYDIHLKPDYHGATFRATTLITGDLPEKSSSITLHAADLTVHDVHVNDEPAAAELDSENQHLHISAAEPFEPGDTWIEVEYEGLIKDTMHGLYWSRFTRDGEEVYILATQFEANHAREVFPCIDEPEAKSTFRLSVDIPSQQTAVSNTSIADVTRVDEETSYITFEDTPVMSTYLLALVVGDIDYTESQTADGVTVRVYATPEQVGYTDFALQTATAALDFYNQYYELAYPLEKCDLIALPDFAAGAMENWGCITFREAVLLVDPDNTSLATKQLAANVIAHELTHQWFGNLVTMQWWNDLWLNEGFATWMANLAVDHIYPEWNVWEQFISNDQIAGMRLDSLQNTHPIEVPIHDPEEIDEIFDAISYKKGASILHMLHAYLGGEDFRRGLSRYLERHAYGNAQTEDLWQALAEISQKPVKDFMSNWTQQSGYPLIRYETSEAGLRLTQQRFKLLPGEAEEDAQTWYVPVSAVDHQPTFLLDRPSDEWKEAPTMPTKLNAGRSGFYRVQYTPEDRERVFQSYSRFSPLDRLGLLDDTFELAKAGYTDTASALSILGNVKDEQSDVVWDVVFLQLTQLQRVFGEQILERIFGPELTGTQLARLGWDGNEDESVFDSLLRPVILNLAVRCNVASVTQEAFRRFRSGQAIDPNIRRTVYTTVARGGDEDVYETLHTMHEQTDFDEEKMRLAQALCSFSQESLIERSLGMITSDEVRKQEVRHWLAYLFSNPHAAQPAWQWMQDNWQWLDDNFRGSHAFPDFPKLAARSFADQDKAAELENFFRGTVPDRSLDQAIEHIHIQAAWYDRDSEAVQKLAES
ncbi:hypothetical protein BRC21_01485 [Candidatus Saccharibacteria bacterium SW_7_54_9]|nr:MAG: hypothetical protein BRC21_01485 [Candidatus Saccharibacteria bacterium SW_7_54_9]